jgi:transcriptional regulator with XRE-family HTH domain
MSQEELAADSGINRPFISNVEKGKRNPSIGTLQSLAQALKTRVSRLMAHCEQCLEEERTQKKA